MALQLQTRVGELDGTVATREQVWPAERTRIAIVLAASNKRAQGALAEEFPEVAEKFNIKDKGMEVALNALRFVKEGVLGALNIDNIFQMYSIPRPGDIYPFSRF